MPSQLAIKEMRMIKYIVLVFVSFFGLLGSNQAQEYNKNDTLNFDIDLDRKVDTIIFDRKSALIVCKLSTQKYAESKSLELAFEEPQSGIRRKGRGFTYFVPQMRSGYHCDFAYNSKLKKIQLKAIDRYEFGPANNNGSGASKVNLITNSYEGNWNYFDEKSNQLVKLPPIKRKMILPQTILENFNDEIVYRYAKMCAALYYKAKKQAEKK